MPEREEFTFPSSTGKDTIFARLWLPDREQPRAMIQIVHGIAEHGGRYAEFAQFLTARGYAVAADDHLGHGKSVGADGCLGYFAAENGWDRVVDDLHTLHERLVARFPGVPQYMLGHSMGSFLARTYLIRYAGELAGCILSGTGWHNPATCRVGSSVAGGESRRIGGRGRSGLVDAMCFGTYNGHFAPCRTKNDWLTRDADIVDRYMEDPLCGFVPTVSLIRDMMGGLKFICTERNLSAMDKTMPVLFIAGDADPVGSYGDGVVRTYRAFRKAGMQNVRLKLYPGGRHEILNETNRSQVYADVAAWLEKTEQTGKED